MMVEIRVVNGKECVDSIIIHTSNISLSKTTIDGEGEVMKIHINDAGCSSYFELTEDEFQHARKKLLAGEPNTVIEFSSKE